MPYRDNRWNLHDYPCTTLDYVYRIHLLTSVSEEKSVLFVIPFVEKSTGHLGRCAKDLYNLKMYLSFSGREVIG